jgi:glutamine amidotransferase
MTVAIIDYGSGNIRSVKKAFERAVEQAGLKMTVVVTNSHLDLEAATHIVLPGVGAFADCRRGLGKLFGMEKALENHVRIKKKPFLGICVGMQLMATIGRENNNTRGLNWLPGEVVELKPSRTELKVPHMGWNNLKIETPKHQIFKGIKNNEHFYFVHSYIFQPTDPSDVMATINYGGQVVAIIGRDNIVGTQFHPEKSQEMGLRLISNFIRWE